MYPFLGAVALAWKTLAKAPSKDEFFRRSEVNIRDLNDDIAIKKIVAGQPIKQ